MNHFLRGPFGCLVDSFFLSWSWMPLMIKFLYNLADHLLMNGFLRGSFGCLIGSFFSLMAMVAIDDSNPFILLTILTLP